MKSINVQIHLEAATSDGTKERSFESKLPKQPKTKKSVQISPTLNENIRKSAVANRNGTNIPVTGKSPGDSQRLFCRRQSSSRDLGLPQGTSGIMKAMNRRNFLGKYTGQGG